MAQQYGARRVCTAGFVTTISGRRNPRSSWARCPVYETTTDAYTNAQPTYPDWDDYRDQVFASVSVFTGRHDITAGYQFRYVGQKGKNISTSGMRANFTNTVPVSVNTYNVPIMDDFSGPVQYRGLGQDQRVLRAG